MPRANLNRARPRFRRQFSASINTSESQSALPRGSGGDFAGASISTQRRNETPKRDYRIEPHNFAEFDELDDIDTPLAALKLGYKGLRVSNALAKNRLRQPGFHAQIAKKAQQDSVMLVVSRARHMVAGLWHRTLESVLE